MNAVIIEDEPDALNLLSRIITEYCMDISLIGHASSVADGVTLIESTKPDLVFLDIRLKDEISFEILEKLEFDSFYLIITTAYDEYALTAFKYEAIDYILKPYIPSKVLSAVDRIKEKAKSQDVFKKLNSILDQSNNKSRITFHTSEGIRLCNIEDIIRLEASSTYCNVYLLNNEKILLSKPLGEIEKVLPEDKFFRVHTSHAINTSYIKSFKNEDGGYVVLMDGTIVPIARRRKKDFITMLEKM